MDALDQMFRVLVRTIRTRHPAFLKAPFTVAELHQQILPYRHFRRDLGLETNQEYELVLMELLTGARGFLDVDEQLRDELGKELGSNSPEPSRVREYADAHVAINPAALAGVSEGGAAAGPAPSTAHQSAAGGGDISPAPLRSGSDPAAEARCRYCGGALPIGAGRVLHFCPHCGQNLQVLNCPACGAEVEAGWKFCVTCGKAVT